MIRPKRSASSSYFRSRSRSLISACLWRDTVSWSSSVATSSGAATRRVRPSASRVTPLARKSSMRARVFIRRTWRCRPGLVHTRRAGVHWIPGGMYHLPPLAGRFGGGGECVSPPIRLHAFTLCMLVVFTSFWDKFILFISMNLSLSCAAYYRVFRGLCKPMIKKSVN